MIITTPANIVNEEVTWNKNKTIVSKTDTFGTILYANDVFSEASEYSTLELIGEPHNIIRHPDMPKVAFKLLWEALKRGENFHAIVKNLTKTGKYYWVITDFTIDKDESGNVTGYTARRKSVPKSVVDKIEPLYKTLLDIEKNKSEKVSEMYFNAYLNEEIGKSYDEFVVDLFEEESKKEKKILDKAKRIKGLQWFFFSEYE
ncbi:PAS domain S-box-containing protein [Tenacibaculum skagerrakense]|uniref:PAS domain S-box-containing protein n=1 Tax=Tenacibaculum skagerrakense TaxID=186571 RepID=A0A4R2P318_9FLAO|nr:PAS domain-containing protein [Tenacibaculum skagerrakense]TCP28105.1 PAS domain S-box-containing protein [Tenacibaculum skagerrakense]